MIPSLANHSLACIKAYSFAVHLHDTRGSRAKVCLCWDVDANGLEDRPTTHKHTKMKRVYYILMLYTRAVFP